MSLSVPQEKLNVVIFGDKTEKAASKLFALYVARSTTILAPKLDSLEEPEKLFKVYEQHENPETLTDE